MAQRHVTNACASGLLCPMQNRAIQTHMHKSHVQFSCCCFSSSVTSFCFITIFTCSHVIFTFSPSFVNEVFVCAFILILSFWFFHSFLSNSFSWLIWMVNFNSSFWWFISFHSFWFMLCDFSWSGEECSSPCCSCLCDAASSHVFSFVFSSEWFLAFFSDRNF